MLLNIKKAFEKRLATLTPSIATAYEGVSFTPTTAPYQRVVLVPNQPLNPTMGSEHYREAGSFQVFLNYPANKGSAEALARAQQIRLLFKRGTTLIEDVTEVKILTTPQISGTSVQVDRLVIPVLISYIADVFE